MLLDPTYLALMALLSLLLWALPETVRGVKHFNDGWSFDRFGPMPDGSTRPEPDGPAAPGFDDAGWRRLDLPHDWGVEGPFRNDLPNNTGKLPFAGIGWYRKAFNVPDADRGKKLYIEIDGAMSQPTVYLNGEPAGEWKYGYSSFRVDLTPFVRFGETNVLAIRLNNEADGSRWYPGGGIYRDVRLVTTDSVAVDEYGVFIHTPVVGEASANVAIETTVRNDRAAQASVVVEHRIMHGEGKQVVEIRSEPLAVEPGSTGLVKLETHIEKPAIWDIDHPDLYTCDTTILVNDKPVDTVRNTFGIRTVEWSYEGGFKLNGRRVRLNGVCMHHDLGALGAAFNVRAAERQVQVMQAMGCNAIRTSHNPPDPKLLDLCDRMGVLVMAELFDCWAQGKTENDYGRFYLDWHERDVRNFVRRDRNHPSIFIWSPGNEICEQSAGEEGIRMAAELIRLFKADDPTRLTTCGNNHAESITNGFAAVFDVIGLNYRAIDARETDYIDQIKANPGQPFVGTETSSVVSTRGEYYFPVSEARDAGFYNFQVSSYDLYAPPWAYPPDFDFLSEDRLAGLEGAPCLAGQFVWTGFDYIGEPTPYNDDKTNLLNFQNDEQKKQVQEMMDRLGGMAPSRSSYFGIVDLAGFPKDRYYLYQAKWRPELPMVHVLPHWNWPERVGQVTPVFVYTSGDSAELFLNGKSLGRKTKGEYEYRLRWNDVIYEPGELKVVAYRDGQPWAETTVATTGPAEAVGLEPDRATIANDGLDLSFVTVSVLDKQGRTVPRTHNPVTFDIEGPGEIVAVDNGDPTSLEPFHATQCKAFNGLCLVIVRAKRGETGSVTLTATSDGLTQGQTTINVKA